MTTYKQNLLWWAKAKTIEDIVDKHFKIINEYAWRSMIQADFTKNFFSLSILRNLNLPSLAYLWIVVTKLPIPLLKAGLTGSGLLVLPLLMQMIMAPLNPDWMIYKKQNSIHDIQINKDFRDCWNMDVTACMAKKQENSDIITPTVDSVMVMNWKLWAKYASSVEQDFTELIWFSWTFRSNIVDIIWAIKKMKVWKN